MLIRIKKGICHYCWIENDLHNQMMEAGKKAEPMWFVPGPPSKRQRVAMRKFMDEQKQKCMVISEVALCYEHLKKLTERLYSNLMRDK